MEKRPASTTYLAIFERHPPDHPGKLTRYELTYNHLGGSGTLHLYYGLHKSAPRRIGFRETTIKLMEALGLTYRAEPKIEKDEQTIVFLFDKDLAPELINDDIFAAWVAGTVLDAHKETEQPSIVHVQRTFDVKAPVDGELAWISEAWWFNSLVFPNAK